jgi:hypothetical protein
MADPRGINPPIEAGMMSREEKKQLVDTACPIGSWGTIANRARTGFGVGAVVGTPIGAVIGAVSGVVAGTPLGAGIGMGVGGIVGAAGGAVDGAVAALRGVKEQSSSCTVEKTSRIDNAAKSLKPQQMRRGLPTP